MTIESDVKDVADHTLYYAAQHQVPVIIEVPNAYVHDVGDMIKDRFNPVKEKINSPSTENGCIGAVIGGVGSTAVGGLAAFAISYIALGPDAPDASRSIADFMASGVIGTAGALIGGLGGFLGGIYVGTGVDERENKGRIPIEIPRIQIVGYDSDYDRILEFKNRNKI